MIKIGITGGKGLLGSLIQKKLKNKRIKFSSFEGDICKKSEIINWINLNQNIEYIFHFAAISSPNKVNQNKKLAHNVNVKGTENLIKALKNRKKKIWFFYPSSSHVYKYSKNKLTEKSALSPISYYGKTKLNAEKIIKKNKSKFISFLIARIFSIYHIKQKKPFLFPSIKERIKYNKKKLYVKNAFCVRDFLNAELVVDIIYKIYIKKLSGIYNIGSGKGISVKSFIEKKFKLDDIIISNHNVNYLVSNNNKINKKLNGRKI